MIYLGKLRYILLGGFSPYPSEKYDFVSWDDVFFPIYGKIKAMFQSTNQIYSTAGSAEVAPFLSH